jgi:hypothetical protein
MVEVVKPRVLVKFGTDGAANDHCLRLVATQTVSLRLKLMTCHH